MKKKVLVFITVLFSALFIAGIFATTNANTTKLKQADERPIGTIGCRGWSPPFGCYWYGQFRPGRPIHGPLMPGERG